MAGGIDIEFEDILGRKQKDKRETEAGQLAQSLLEKGAEPDTVNKITQKYMQTGQIDIPQMQTKALPYDPEVPEGRSTQVPFSLAKRKGLFAFNSQTGQFEQQQTPDGMTDFDVKSYNVGKPSVQGYNIFVNSQTGQEIRRTPNNNGKDEVIRIAPPDPNKGAKDPEVDLAKDTLKKYQAALLKGDDIPDEFMDSVRSAADKVGVDLAEVQKDPSALDQLWNSTAKAISRVPGAPQVAPSKPKYGGTAVRFKPKAGKPLTKDLAQKFLQQAGGDKNKARDLATKSGYTF